MSCQWRDRERVVSKDRNSSKSFPEITPYQTYERDLLSRERRYRKQAVADRSGCMKVGVRTIHDNLSGDILLLSGHSGSDKSTIGETLAHSPGMPMVYFHNDDLWVYIKRDRIDPWLPQFNTCVPSETGSS